MSATATAPASAQQLEVIDVAEGRVHVIDARGHYLQGFDDRRQAEAFVAGYVLGRQDAGAIVAAVAARLSDVSAR